MNVLAQNLDAEPPSRGDAAAGVAPSSTASAPGRGADFAELVKARLTALVLLTTAVGFYLGVRGPVEYGALLRVFLGTAAAAGGAAALNQWWEWQLEALMQRTRSRPVPAGRMQPVSAF